MSLTEAIRPRVEVVCSGTAYEMGLAQGVALREKITAARQSLADLEAFRIEQPRWMPYSAFRTFAERQAANLIARPLGRDYPHMDQRVAGLAEGAKLKPDAILLFNALEPLLSNVRGRTVVPCPGACSVVAVRAERSGIGEPIVAKNFDYLPLVQPFYALRDSRPQDGCRAIEFTAAPLAGTIDGINEHGLCITYNYAFTVDEASPTGTISMLIAETLQRCTTVAEAADWIASRTRWGAGLLMLADARGDLASLELSSTRLHLRRPAADEQVLYHTNTFTAESMREIEIDKQAIFTDRAPAPLRGRRVQESAERRDCRIAELLARPGLLGPAELAALMADHGPDNAPGDYTLCTHGSYWHTTACLQFFPKSRRIRVDFAHTCEAQFQEITFDSSSS